MGQIAHVAQGTQIRAARPGMDFKDLLRREWPRIQAVMPKAMDPERMMQIAISAYNTTPKLSECSVVSMLSCVMKCASLGLEPSAVDGLGRAYILPYYNGKTHHLEAQMIVGYRGMIDLARRSGELRSIHAQAVFQGDTYRHWEDETGQHFNFEAADVPHDPDRLTDVYVCAHLKDGGFVFETMTRREVDEVRKRSKASASGPWVTDYVAMACKTVIRRSFKYLPVSVEAREAAAADETTPDYGAVLDPVVTEPVATLPEVAPDAATDDASAAQSPDHEARGTADEHEPREEG